MAEHIVVYHPFTRGAAAGRIAWVFNWLLGQRLRIPFSITTNAREAADAACCIAYAINIPRAIYIPAYHLPGHKEQPWIGSQINDHIPAIGNWHGIPSLFHVGNEMEISFDIVAAIFYLLTRYEEYLPYTPDKHGRYPATESILFKEGILSRPVVDEWVAASHSMVRKKWLPQLLPLRFSFQPTYDIDIAYSLAHKGVRRIFGAYVRALLKGDVAQINERTQVLKRKKADPFDSFAYMHSLHERYGCKALYFVLCALRTSAFDKNIHPQHPAMRRVIRQLLRDGDVSIHPSYFATRADIILREKRALESTTNQPNTASRQHYIRFSLPATPRLLLECGITDDHSMGYGTHLGFRAGTGSSFLWYDLEKEKATSLRLHPFCFMDTTAHYDQGLTPQAAFAELHTMQHALQTAGSTLTTIFHNFSLGTAPEWAGWKEEYERFLNTI